MSIGKEEREAVLRVMDRGVLSGYRGSWGDWFYGGEEVQALEKEWASYFGVKHAIACNSATSGLWIALAATGLTSPYDWSHNLNSDVNGCDEIIVTPWSMTCSASMPLHFGAEPVFADIEPDYFCLDPKSVEERITRYTMAILVVDLFGMPYDADAINAIAEKYSKKYKHKIYVIEDAAQACGATYKGKYAGTLGDIGVYSLNVHKHIQSGEGGIVVTDNDELAFKIRLSMNHSEAVINSMPEDENVWSSCLELVGMNMRMTELSAAIAREQLKKLSGILAVYQENAKNFLIKIRPGCTSAFYKYAWVPKTHDDEQYLAYLMMNAQDKFNFKKHYIDPIYTMPLFSNLGYDPHLCPTCEEVEKDIVLAWFREVV